MRMFDDPIVREIREYREEYAASLDYDLDRIVADLQSRQGKDGRKVVDRSEDSGTRRAEAPTHPVASRCDGSSSPESK